jgi:phosphoglycolate phosphatase
MSGVKRLDKIKVLAEANLVIFDWDGTLVDSASHIIRSLQSAALAMGLPKSGAAQCKEVIGLGMREVVGKLYPSLEETDILRFRRCYAQAFSTDPAAGTAFFKGALAFVQCLRRNGVDVCVATGKSRVGLDEAMRFAGVGDLFGYSRCADESVSKPDPTMLYEIVDYFNVAATDAVMVGDSRYDLEMAQRAGIKSVGVSFGVHSVNDLRRYDPVIVVDSYEQMSLAFGFEN